MDDGGRAPALLSWLSHNTSTRRSQRAQEPDERCVTPLKKYHMISPIASNRDYVGYVAPIILLNPSTTCSTTLETLRATHKTSVFAMPFLEKNRKKTKETPRNAVFFPNQCTFRAKKGSNQWVVCTSWTKHRDLGPNSALWGSEGLDGDGGNLLHHLGAPCGAIPHHATVRKPHDAGGSAKTGA